MRSVRETETLCERLDKLLRNRPNKENPRRLGRMAETKNPHVHMETVDENAQKKRKPDETRRTRVASV